MTWTRVPWILALLAGASALQACGSTDTKCDTVPCPRDDGEGDASDAASGDATREAGLDSGPDATTADGGPDADAARADAGDAQADGADGFDGSDGFGGFDGYVCDPSKEPKDDPCVLDNAYGVFVSTAGHDGAAGTCGPWPTSRSGNGGWRSKGILTAPSSGSTPIA
jgi:hypothetical protein